MTNKRKKQNILSQGEPVKSGEAILEIYNELSIEEKAEMQAILVSFARDIELRHLEEEVEELRLILGIKTPLYEMYRSETTLKRQHSELRAKLQRNNERQQELISALLDDLTRWRDDPQNIDTTLISVIVERITELLNYSKLNVKAETERGQTGPDQVDHSPENYHVSLRNEQTAAVVLEHFSISQKLDLMIQIIADRNLSDEQREFILESINSIKQPRPYQPETTSAIDAIINDIHEQERGVREHTVLEAALDLFKHRGQNGVTYGELRMLVPSDGAVRKLVHRLKPRLRIYNHTIKREDTGSIYQIVSVHPSITNHSDSKTDF